MFGIGKNDDQTNKQNEQNSGETPTEGLCEFCGKEITMDSSHNIDAEGGEKHYCCENCCKEHEAQDDKEAKKSTECEFC